MNSARLIEIYIHARKLHELLTIDENEYLSICGISEEAHSPSASLHSLREYCTDREKEILDMALLFLESPAPTYNPQQEEPYGPE